MSDTKIKNCKKDCVNKVKSQHYVPQFLLNNFNYRKRKKKNKSYYYLYVYDKHEDNIYSSSVENIAHENYYYNISKNESAESFFHSYETAAGSIVKEIINTESLRALSHEDKSELADFLALQFARSPHVRKIHSGIAEELSNVVERFKDNGLDISASDMNGKAMSISSMMVNYKDYANRFLEKDWYLLKTDSVEFQIGDSPIVRNNVFNKNSDKVSLGSDYIEIYMPLCPQLTLMLLCPKIYQFFERKTIEELHRYRDGDYFVSNPLQVDLINKLHVMYSRRYIYSKNNNFDIAKKLIKNHPNLKDGLGFVVEKVFNKDIWGNKYEQLKI